MDAREEFLDWFATTWRPAEVALHGGDAGPRDRTWARRDPVTLFGAWYDASGPAAVREVFERLAATFGASIDADIELVAADVSGDLAYTVHREHTRARVDDVDRTYSLRVTQVYRREPDGWKVVHRHGDPGPAAP
ncbi:hypothetical protein GCM10022237_01800 [Nocardioides ginsengisoli]|uniref:YybH family protein n=1 Tax=Nocardioides ginsengisoli TaxID=363868 RepID=A0ABW3W7A7_9ACTN